MKLKSIFGYCLALLMAVTLTTSTYADEFGIGSDAPDLDIEHWVSDNDGLFEHVTKLEDGKVYVIEFWATWCGPCIQQMPHIVKVQEKYSDEVQIISVSDEDLDTVEEFLDRKVRGDKEKRTYRELTNSYCLTADPDKSVFDAYFRAAGQTGIPCAFIVGKDKKVEWIGHPGSMDKPLEQVVNGKWDRTEFKKEFEEERARMKKRMEARMAMQKILGPIGKKMQEGDTDGAIELLDEAIAESQDNEEMVQQLKSIRFQIAVQMNHDSLPDALQEFIDDNQDSPMDVNNMIWTIYERHEAKGDVDKEVLEIALKGAEWAAKNAPEEGKGAILDTLAHLIYVVEKDLDRAIKVQKEAIEAAGEAESADLKPFLKALEEEKKTGKKPGKKKKRVEESDF